MSICLIKPEVLIIMSQEAKDGILKRHEIREKVE